VYVIAAVVAAASVIITWRWLFSQNSIQAFFNARIIEIRSPIQGVWKPNSENVAVGNQLLPGRELGEVDGKLVNPLAIELRLREAALRQNIAVVQDTIQNTEGRIATRQQRLTSFEELLADQNSMQATYSGLTLSSAEALLAEANHEKNLMKTKYRRIDELARLGLVSELEHTSTRLTHQMAQARTAALRSQLSKAQLDLKANELGLQLEGTMTFSYPRLRVEELEDKLRDLSLDLQSHQTSLTSLKAQYEVVSNTKAFEDYRQIVTDKSVLIWSIEAQGETHVIRGQPLIRVIDCSDIWVEAFVDERAAASYHKGDEVEISAINNQGKWQGEVQFIRYGSGRITLGQPVTAPPPEISRRQLPVRVATLIVRLSTNTRNDREGLSCPIGLSVKVRHAN